MHTAYGIGNTAISAFSTLKWALIMGALLLATVGYGQGLTITLNTTDYNGYHVSCFGKKDGAIDASVTGGTPPYTYEWSNGSTTQGISELASGYYNLKVSDATGASAEADKTLIEPEVMKVILDPYKYPNGYHISCNECFNGSIDVSVTGGVAPFAYLWSDGATTQDRSGLGSFTFDLEVTDGNACMSASEKLLLSQPERMDWTMNGNSNTNPTANFFGTTDNTDVVFKTNGTERLRLLGNGQIKIGGLAPGLLGVDGDGFLKDFPLAPAERCADELFPFWRTGGNLLETCDPSRAILGSLDHHHVNFVTDNDVRMRITATGHTQFGGDIEEWPQTEVPARVNIRQGPGSWLSMQCQGSTPQTSVGYWEFNNPPEQDRMILLWTPTGGDYRGIISFFNDGKVSIGNVTTPTDPYTYGLYLEKGLLTEKVKVAIKTGAEWSDHVFQPNYRLMPLNEVSAYIKRHGHLPGVPSAERMVEQGLDVVKTDAMLLEKIEELTLHMISISERLKEIEAENARLRELIKL